MFFQLLKNVLVSIAMLSVAGLIGWIAYQDSLATQKEFDEQQRKVEILLSETKAYEEQNQLELQAIQQDIQELQDDLTATFGSDFSDTPITRRTTYSEPEESKSEFSEVETDYVKCLISLQYSELSTKEKQVACYEIVKAYHPDADFRSILFSIGYVN